MKRILMVALALLMVICVYGCKEKEAAVTKDTAEEITIADTEEPKSSENITEADSQITETEKGIPTDTEKTVERVTEEFTPPVINPVIQSYIEVYELKEEQTSIEKYVVSDSEYAIPVVFEAVGEIKDFRICGVEMTYGYDEITETVLDNISFADGERIAVMLDFPGDMSTWYFSYTNNVGKVYEYQIYISGMDGSLVSTAWQ